ncbi:MAG TPA: septum formation initiator family protein [Sphaerochaeta sp.]|nr:septum formation initiator family protein [Sphaerochaeta sp.]
MNKSIQRKLQVIFTLGSILAYFILLGLFGEDGYLHARSVRSELELLTQREEALLLQVDSLKLQMEQMTTQDALKDAAFRFGYQEQGEQVFYFASDGEAEPPQQEQSSIVKPEKQAFPGFAKRWIALMALAFSSVLTLVWGIVAKRRSDSR